MVKKRKPGGGRKPNPNKKVMFSTRLEPHVMAALKAGAEKWPGGNVSTFTERLINDGLREREEAARDPALRALLYMIARLSAYISGGAYETDDPGKSLLLARWRSDPFQFMAFKFAVIKLLNLLDEPAGELLPPPDFDEEIAKEYAQGFGTDHPLHNLFLQASKSPEAYGVLSLFLLWHQGRGAKPPSQQEDLRDFFEAAPDVGAVAEREFYAVPRARRELELKPTKSKG